MSNKHFLEEHDEMAEDRIWKLTTYMADNWDLSTVEAAIAEEFPEITPEIRKGLALGLFNKWTEEH